MYRSSSSLVMRCALSALGARVARDNLAAANRR
ncbi:MAG: hypothetical protein RLZZ387_3613 [Chloroflexota bacterium]|jgi:hypothetical protein